VYTRAPLRPPKFVNLGKAAEFLFTLIASAGWVFVVVIQNLPNARTEQRNSRFFGENGHALSQRLCLAVMTDVTRILSAIDQGDPHAPEKLLPLVYDELRKLAAQKLAQEKPGQTLQATALVHEAYVRLVGPDSANAYRDRSHFFATAATAMRHILIEQARKKQTKKRGGKLTRQPLEAVAAQERDEELLAVDEALQKLAVDDPQKARLVELRFFGGLTGDQAAQVLGISTSTADRYWAFARAWLQAQVRGS